ncbi:thermonuclease family protein [Virgibacillus kekensis]|uniref:Thermonuclease family protein n=1 Tax=Virgibacillus kekensis TaxID=202261 RepID=A0ABV9DGG2_9BACI
MAKKLLLLFTIILSGCSAGGSPSAELVRVVDGDTLLTKINGEEEYIRLLLVDTPETKHPDLSVQPYGKAASNFLKETFSKSKSIRLEYGTDKRDKYDRLLAYVYTQEGKMVNKLLLRKGLARVAYVYPPNDKYVEEFRKIEQKAQKQNLNIWSLEGYVTEEGFNPKMKSTEKPPEIQYDPMGPDRDCDDFTSQREAQAFFEASGGPETDSHRLDGEGDGRVCEGL